MKKREDSPIYLSRLILNPRSRQVAAELTNPYEMHRTLMRAFPRTIDKSMRKAREEYGVLFRTDFRPPAEDVKLYVQSLVEPEWSFLAQIRGYLSDRMPWPNPSFKDVTGSLEGIAEGQVLSFRLRANPTKRLWKADETKDNLRKGQRIGLLREQDQIDWLGRKGRERAKGKPGGFEILAERIVDVNGNEKFIPRLKVVSEGIQKSRKKEDGKSLKTSHLAVTFDGLLRITNADDFRKTLVNGIGSAKAYGFGLLSIAPARGYTH